VSLRLVAPGHGASVRVVLVAAGVTVVGRCIRRVLILSPLRSFGECALERRGGGGLATWFGE
jgi:hypothetical protein